MNTVIESFAKYLGYIVIIGLSVYGVALFSYFLLEAVLGMAIKIFGGYKEFFSYLKNKKYQNEFEAEGVKPNPKSVNGVTLEDVILDCPVEPEPADKTLESNLTRIIRDHIQDCHKINIGLAGAGVILNIIRHDGNPENITISRKVAEEWFKIFTSWSFVTEERNNITMELKNELRQSLSRSK